MKTINEPPPEVTDWINARKGFREPVFCPGAFDGFAASRMAASWGQPLGGCNTGTGYKVAVAQPSPRSKGDKAFLFFDYAKTP